MSFTIYLFLLFGPPKRWSHHPVIQDVFLVLMSRDLPQLNYVQIICMSNSKQGKAMCSHIKTVLNFGLVLLHDVCGHEDQELMVQDKLVQLRQPVSLVFTSLDTVDLNTETGAGLTTIRVSLGITSLLQPQEIQQFKVC